MACHEPRNSKVAELRPCNRGFHNVGFDSTEYPPISSLHSFPEFFLASPRTERIRRGDAYVLNVILKIVVFHPFFLFFLAPESSSGATFAGRLARHRVSRDRKSRTYIPARSASCDASENLYIDWSRACAETVSAIKERKEEKS